MKTITVSRDLQEEAESKQNFRITGTKKENLRRRETRCIRKIH